MGLIKKVLGGVFALLGGILKVFGIGKKGEFFMELDESEADASEPVPAKTRKQPESTEAAAPQAATANAAQTQAPQKQAEPPQPRVLSQSTNTANPVQSKPVVEKKSTAPAVTNFATDYLVNPKVNYSPRRRPGPSVSPFKEMVRDMKKSPSMG